MRDIDYSAATEFLARFFAGTEHQVEIRALPNEQGAGRNFPTFTREPAVVELHCQRFDGEGRAVYFGVCTRRSGGGSGRREDCVELPALWSEVDTEKLGLDKEEVIARVRGMLVPPSITIDSGRGLHFYWMLHEPIDISIDQPEHLELEESIKSTLRQLANIMAGDTQVCDLARVMRLPGTHNTKGGGLRPCFVVEATDARYEISDIQDMLDTQRPIVMRPEIASALVIEINPFLEAAKRFSFKPTVDVEQRLASMRYLGDGDDGVHSTQLSVSASLVAQGVDDGEIVELLLNATMAAAGLHGAGWNWKREEKIILGMVASAHPKFDPPPERITRPSATIHRLAAGGPQPAATETTAPDTDAESPAAEPATLAGFPLNDLGNAQRLIVKYGPMMRYVVGIGWHVWDGRRFENDPAEVAARRYAHETARWMMLQAFDRGGRTKKAIERATTLAKFAITSGNANKIAGMLSSAEPHIAVKAERLNSDGWLLNCLNGTVDLRTGMLLPHSQADLITKIIPVEYDPFALCPTWGRFLIDIFDGDMEMVDFLQRGLGYSLSGSTREQVIFILHGGGANGKSVLLETIAALLGDYASHCPSETFTSQERGSGIPNDVARLAGSRFVSIVETEHDRKLAEGLVKQATGTDRLTARFMRQEFFEFVPQFKLWLATNHKPRISGTDNAIWRRIRLMPFNVTFVDEADAREGDLIKDLDMKNKLLDELPGILRWAVEGCLLWQSEGALHSPTAVTDATRDYRATQDIISGFLEECCNSHVSIECSSGKLYDSYKKWCASNGERTASSSEFGSSLTEKGYPPRKGSHGIRIRKGLDLKPVYDQNDEDWRE